MKYFILLIIAAAISSVLVNFNPETKRFQKFNSIKYSHSAIENFRDNWEYVLHIYESITGVPTVVLINKEGHVVFMNLETKEVISKHTNVDLSEAYVAIHHVVNGADFIFTYSFSGFNFYAFKDTKLFAEEEVDSNAQSSSIDLTELGVFKDYVLLRAYETPLALFKFNKDYSEIKLVAQNSYWDGPTPIFEVDEIANIKVSSETYLLGVTDDKIVSYFIDEKTNKIEIKESIEVPLKFDYFAIIGTNSFYGSSHKEIWQIRRDPSLTHKKVTLPNRILDLSALNENTLIADSDHEFYLIDTSTWEVTTINSPDHYTISIFNEFITIDESKKKEGRISIYKPSNNTAHSEFSFLF
jgi:hypothetical protein